MPKEFQDKPPPIRDTQLEIESDSEEFTYHPDINSDEDVNDDFVDDQVDELGDDIVESSTLISLEVTPVITEIIDVFPKDNTPIPPEVATIMKLVDVFPKDVTRNGISQTHLTHPLLALHFHN